VFGGDVKCGFFEITPDAPSRIETGMKITALLTLGLGLVTLTGCSPNNQNPTPEQIRQDTAKAAETAAKDAKAVVQGVEDAAKAKNANAVNINTATPDQLKSLPGIDDVRAHRIIANRPYGHSDDLVRKHIVSQAEYDRISGQVVAQ
jgi:DNA uptake protein ComE-like DNA-binding protein